MISSNATTAPNAKCLMLNIKPCVWRKEVMRSAAYISCDPCATRSTTLTRRKNALRGELI